MMLVTNGVYQVLLANRKPINYAVVYRSQKVLNRDLKNLYLSNKMQHITQNFWFLSEIPIGPTNNVST